MIVNIYVLILVIIILLHIHQNIRKIYKMPMGKTTKRKQIYQQPLSSKTFFELDIFVHSIDLLNQRC